MRYDGDMEKRSDSSIDMHLALLDPQQVFSSPEEVVNHPALEREDKIRILRRWEYDVRDLEVAEEEGMPASGVQPEGLLKRILTGLTTLGADLTAETSTPTKHGNA